MGQPRRGIRRPRRDRLHNRASSVITSFADVPPGTPVVLWCRVSSGPQAANGNNADQEAELRAAAAARGCPVVAVRTHDGRATDAEAKLYDAARTAAAAGAVLLAEGTSRFVRSPNFHPSSRPNATPAAPHLRNLKPACGDVPLATLHHPDETPAEERGRQTVRGMEQKGRHGGRPRKAEPRHYAMDRNRRLRPKARYLYRMGKSLHAIARTLKTSRRNVQRWVKTEGVHFAPPPAG